MCIRAYLTSSYVGLPGRSWQDAGAVNNASAAKPTEISINMLKD